MPNEIQKILENQKELKNRYTLLQQAINIAGFKDTKVTKEDFERIKMGIVLMNDDLKTTMKIVKEVEKEILKSEGLI